MLKPNTDSPLHPRNLHRSGYDFNELVNHLPDLKAYVRPNKYGNLSVDFFDPMAVKLLNRSLLKMYYGIEYWDIPQSYLCPPVPGRADYIHYLADLMAEYNGGRIPKLPIRINGLDIGTGANCIYPILAQKIYGWTMIGSESDKIAYQSATDIVKNNLDLKNVIDVRYQSNIDKIFDGIITTKERFDFVMCNPPFYDSPSAANRQSYRKHKNLKKNKANLKFTRNFGGQPHELWCEGGEAMFIERMIEESTQNKDRCFFFTSIVSNQDNLVRLKKVLESKKAKVSKTITMAQGQKKSHILAWSFLDSDQRSEWAISKWRDSNLSKEL